jgi:hypothetical protein
MAKQVFPKAFFRRKKAFVLQWQNKFFPRLFSAEKRLF